MVGLGKPQLHAKFEVAGFIYNGIIREFVSKRQIRFLSHPLGELGVTYGLQLWHVGKRVVDFLFAIIELFSIALTADVLIRRNRLCSRGWVTLGLNIRVKGYVYRQHLYTIR